MENLIQYFEVIPSSIRTIFLISGLTLFLLLEKGIPLFNFDYKKGKHALLNLTLTLTTLMINFVGATFILKATMYNSNEKSGLINIDINGEALPSWFMVVLALIFLDFGGAWLIHWVEHRVKWMWKFHIIHHTDQQIDVTTGLRHHPCESIFRLGFTIIAVLFSGASIGIVMFYQTISAFFAHFSHANYKTPKTLDKLLSWVLVTPRFHRIHHHFTLPYTDSNFGNIFSIWDYIFRTNMNVGEHKELKFGLDTHMDSKEIESIKGLLLIPFQKYRHPMGAKFKE